MQNAFPETFDDLNARYKVARPAGYPLSEQFTFIRRAGNGHRYWRLMHNRDRTAGTFESITASGRAGFMFSV